MLGFLKALNEIAIGAITQNEICILSQTVENLKCCLKLLVNQGCWSSFRLKILLRLLVLM